VATAEEDLKNDVLNIVQQS